MVNRASSQIDAQFRNEPAFMLLACTRLLSFRQPLRLAMVTPGNTMRERAFQRAEGPLSQDAVESACGG